MSHAWQMCDTMWDKGALTRVALRAILGDALILTILNLSSSYLRRSRCTPRARCAPRAPSY